MLRSRRNLMLGTVLASASLAIDGALAQQPAAQQPPAQPAEAGRPDKLLEDLVAANKILADQGVLDGYGHVSVRSPTNPERFWMARSVAPELVTAARHNNLQVVTWTINAPAQMRALISAGVDGIMTDYPDRLVAVLRE